MIRIDKPTFYRSSQLFTGFLNFSQVFSTFLNLPGQLIKKSIPFIKLCLDHLSFAQLYDV